MSHKKGSQGCLFIFILAWSTIFSIETNLVGHEQCDQNKIAKCLQKLPKMITIENDGFLTTLRKLPKNVGDLSKLIVDKGFKKLPKVQ